MKWVTTLIKIIKIIKYINTIKYLDILIIIYFKKKLINSFKLLKIIDRKIYYFKN